MEAYENIRQTISESRAQLVDGKVPHIDQYNCEPQRNTCMLISCSAARRAAGMLELILIRPEDAPLCVSQGSGRSFLAETTFGVSELRDFFFLQCWWTTYSLQAISCAGLA